MSAPHGFAADSAGSAAAVAGRAGADGGRSKLNADESNADESSAGDCSATLLADVSRSGSGSFGRLLRDAPMVSEGSAGTPSAMVSSAAERPVSCARAGLPLGTASLAAVGRSILGRGFLDPVPRRRRAVGRKTGAGRTVGYSIVRRRGLGGCGLGCGRLLRRPPGRHRDAVWLRVLLVADQVITGSP